MMKREEYLTKSEEYTLVYREGGSWGSSLVVMRALPNGLRLSRCGFSVSKRVGKAVTRNSVNRLLREILRSASLRPGWDIVFVARPAAAMADYAELKRTIEGLLLRAQLLVENHEEIRLRAN